MTYQKLFERGKIGSLELKNRIVMPAMGCNLAEITGEAGARMIRYYAERARGGAALIITEITRVDNETGVGTANQLSVTGTQLVPQLSRLAEAVHTYNSKIFVQLHHPGNQTPSRLIGGRQPVSASDVTCKVIGEKPRPMTTQEVEAMVRKFVSGAVIAQRAGIDGVEIHAAHGYLVSQFLSPHTNKRTDKYGGSFEGRMRFAQEIILGIQKACGPAYPVSIRINGSDYLKDGITEEDAVAQAKFFEGLGVACINVSCGTYDSGPTIVEPSYFEEGWKKQLAANIKAAVKIPVIAVCNIKHPEFAEKLLEEGVTDYVGIARGHLADPEFGNKAMAGRSDMIRKCLGCMECFRLLNLGMPVGCTINPLVGREFEFGKDKLVKNGAGRTVAVAGGGPAGMEAALTLAKRGFKTILFEAGTRLGGTVNEAAVPPDKGMLREFIETMETQLREAGVEIRLGTEADAAVLKETGAEAVFLAAGGKPVVPAIAGIERAVTAEAVLREAEEGKNTLVKGENVVVIGGGVTGLETAEFLSGSHKVTVVEMTDKVGNGLYVSVMLHLTKAIAGNGGEIAKCRKVISLGDGEVVTEDTKTGEKSTIPADTVVLAMGVRPYRPAEEELLREFAGKVICVGDSLSPGRIYDALHSGYNRAFAYQEV